MEALRFLRCCLASSTRSAGTVGQHPSLLHKGFPRVGRVTADVHSIEHDTVAKQGPCGSWMGVGLVHTLSMWLLR